MKKKVGSQELEMRLKSTFAHSALENSVIKKPAAPCADVSLNPQKQVGAASVLQDEIIIRKAK